MNTTHHAMLTLGAALLLIGCTTTNAPTKPDPASDVDMTANVTPEPARRELLTPAAAGEFTIGGTLDTFDNDTGWGEKVLAQGVLAIAVAIPNVCAIDVMSSRFVTEEGLSVDSTAGEWSAAYGEISYNYDTGLYEPGDGASGYGLILDTESQPPEADADVLLIRIGVCPI